MEFLSLYFKWIAPPIVVRIDAKFEGVEKNKVKESGENGRDSKFYILIAREMYVK